MDEEELEHFRRTEVKKLFDVVDQDASGFIDRDEMSDLLSKLGRTDLAREEIDATFVKLDTDGSGRIEFEEFFQWYISSIIPTR